MNADNNAPLLRAITAVGTASDLARLLGITPQAVLQWTEIPIKRVADVSRVTGIPLHELRPDVFDAPKPEGDGQ